ncbi:MAG: hypothetical protein AB7G44_12530 [Bacteroidia bacterium]
MNEQPDHYHRKRLREKQNSRLLGIVTIIVLALAVGVVVMEII